MLIAVAWSALFPALRNVDRFPGSETHDDVDSARAPP
jgi:hypothetical protein